MDSLPAAERPLNPFVTASFAGTREMTDELLHLYLVGNYWIFLNSQEIPSAEGEGDLPLEYWRKVHGELYTPYLKSWGVQKLEDATVITKSVSSSKTS